MFDNKGRYIINEYAVKSTFSSFLPGISGKYGIPIWCFYVNRGQGITSFGLQDKEHSIMEFYPAHQAYQLTKTFGFRTFLRIDGSYLEPFNKDKEPKKMYIGMNEMEIEEVSTSGKVRMNVLYFTLPGEEIGGLVRKVTIKNLDNREKNIEILDGMPAILPYGVSITSMKTMGQTTKAWMQAEDKETALPYFRVRVGMEDTADVHKVEGGHFYFTIDEGGSRLPVIVDTEVIFEYDTAMTAAVGFKAHDLEELYKEKQVDKNSLPCAFFGKKAVLPPDGEMVLYGLIGQVGKKEQLLEFSQKCNAGYFEGKYKEAVKLTAGLCEVIYTKTASAVFDAYCRQTFLDNLLRGGCPVRLGEDKIFYLYSRKHGDIERDYNFFSLLPEFYSQGNANFRDVNQNRRCDVLFYPFVKEYNIKTFYNLIQTDGYNPLSVEKNTYFIEEKDRTRLVSFIEDHVQEIFREFLSVAFTPGSLFHFLNRNRVSLKTSIKKLFNTVINTAKESVNADFGEGYWSDHWTYNLDLVESYLMIYPDKEKKLLFEDDTYTYFESKAIIKPRKDRYVMTENGIRQYRAIDKERKKDSGNQLVRTKYGKGDLFTTNLIAKLILLCVTKTAALDSYGMGVEMEGGKPGWYDALNGLPGIFGSSMCETYELNRMLLFTVDKLKKYKLGVKLPIELNQFLEEVSAAIKAWGYGRHDDTVFQCWDQVNTAKEAYRDKTAFGFHGTTITVCADTLIGYFEGFIDYVRAGIQRALKYGKGISPAYFAYEVKDYETKEDGIHVSGFRVIPMPHFLEGPVRYLKAVQSREEKKTVYDHVKSSCLYDKKLNMYKVNESLENTSFEVGRAKAFTPGWLENESIWLHMEYKYLLEVLKAGLYEEFFEDFKTQCIPFLNANRYGRSPLENSSFLASSANPNEKIHGKGFVARLSGSTAEFLHIWQLMLFGRQPFTITEKGLELSLNPVLPAYLIGEEKEVTGTFLGIIKTVYHFNQKGNVVPGNYEVIGILVTYQSGRNKQISGNRITGEDALAVREGLVKALDITIKIKK